MKLIFVLFIMNLFYLESDAQIDTDTIRFIPPEFNITKLDTNNHSRVIKLKIDSHDINLSDDFIIKVVNNNNTIELKSLNNTILLPYKFSKDSTYEVIFAYSNYELHFKKIMGVNFSYLTTWIFFISTATDSMSQKTNLWLFEPFDKDGWVIEADNLYIGRVKNLN